MLQRCMDGKYGPVTPVRALRVVALASQEFELKLRERARLTKSIKKALCMVCNACVSCQRVHCPLRVLCPRVLLNAAALFTHKAEPYQA